MLGDGEYEAAALEAELFGNSEFESEIAPTEAAFEAALAEVLAAEAAHAGDVSEAESLLGAAVPLVVRSMGAQHALRPVLPAVIRANGQLVSSLHRLGPAGRQLLRLDGAIMRRTIGALLAAQQRGLPLTPTLVRDILAAQTLRVLQTPRLAGPALLRNTLIRQTTVAPAGRRPAQPAPGRM